MTLRLLCLPGDGVGPEITAATRQVVSVACAKAGVDLTLVHADIGFKALKEKGSTIPDSVVVQAKIADGVILGPVSHNVYPPREEGGLNPSGILRARLDLHANIRPARSYPAVPTPTGVPVDLVVVRENLEGFYADRNMHMGQGEFMPTPDVALAIRRITRQNSRNIARTAFAMAETRKRRVTVIHKANVLRVTDGLFLEEVRAIAAEHPQVETEEVLIDAAAALLVRDPRRFDVILATNMYGDILSDLASELAGGLGLAASLNLGTRNAIAQAQHGSAPDLSGQDKANPVSLIGSAVMLLEHLGHLGPASAIDAALDAAMSRPETRTADLGGPLGTKAFADHLCHVIERA